MNLINKLIKILTAIFVVFFIISCQRNSQQNIDTSVVNIPISADKSDSSTMPKITFESLNHDFGTLMQGEKVSYTYHFTNTGKSPLIVSAVIPSCGCTVAQFTRTPILPSKKGEICINFNTETKQGLVNSSIVVQANTYPSETRLSFTATVKK